MKNLKNKFFGYLLKLLALKNFIFSLFNFVPEKSHVDLKKTLFLGWEELGLLGLRGISPKLNKTAMNFGILLLRFSLGIKKHKISSFSVKPFQKQDRKFFFEVKIAGKGHITLFEFSQRPKSWLNHQNKKRK